MRVLIQRSKNASVTVEQKIVGQIDFGIVLFVGFTSTDVVKDIEYLVKKIVNLRIFEDEFHKMNQSLLDIKGSALSISQFTLYADTKKGNRPSYISAMEKQTAKEMYDLFNQELSKYVTVQTGIFQADMKVSLINDGPVTIMLESEMEKNDKK